MLRCFGSSGATSSKHVSLVIQIVVEERPMKWIIVAIGVLFSGLTIAQGDSKCVTDRIQAIKGEKWIDSGEMRVTCEPMHIDGFRGCVDRQNRDEPFILPAPDGWQFLPDTARFVETSRNAPDRNGAKLTEQTTKRITAQLYCHGHGCGGEGRVWIAGVTRVKAVMVPTADDINSIMRACGFN